ncbi:hypothetical protein CNYM01_14150 [Colletotrichum nymphaeae SA-01]|uniref:Uncharacterized protein n=1 Tax=Colletotrichum nymphaeae SA-01 TaxID=1460502 RepID=A0A135UJ81_9PEZI|nr:hypothetical protein CNYM01_14150 [Colletotrichum nymphaeae SA-01]
MSVSTLRTLHTAMEMEPQPRRPWARKPRDTGDGEAQQRMDALTLFTPDEDEDEDSADTETHANSQPPTAALPSMRRGQIPFYMTYGYHVNGEKLSRVKLRVRPTGFPALCKVTFRRLGLRLQLRVASCMFPPSNISAAVLKNEPAGLPLGPIDNPR